MHSYAFPSFVYTLAKNIMELGKHQAKIMMKDLCFRRRYIYCTRLASGYVWENQGNEDVSLFLWVFRYNLIDNWHQDKDGVITANADVYSYTQIPHFFAENLSHFSLYVH